MSDPSDESGLPYIDEHTARVTAEPNAVWSALASVLRRDLGGSALFARTLGCEPARCSADFQCRVGDTLPGFRVEAFDGRSLRLRGRHRFSDYALTFVLDRDQLRAQTHAEFPGLHGRLYRALVISSGIHGRVTRRMLRRIVRAA